MKLLYRVCSLLLAGGVFATVTPAQTTSPIITACVSKFDGFSRIVANPGACVPRFETVVQWNSRGPSGPAGAAGPTGPTGPQGPPGTPGMALAHTILISAGGTPSENGQAFQAALASITDSSAINPYIVQLDAGTYTLPAPSGPVAAALALPAFVSVKGAGMYSTFINSQATAFSFASSESVGTVASLSDLTVTASGGYAITISNAASLLVDHVQANGYSNFSAATTGDRFLITNSVLNGPTSVRVGPGHATFLATQVLNFANTNYAPGLLACFSVYDVNLQPYPAGCASSAP